MLTAQRLGPKAEQVFISRGVILSRLDGCDGVHRENRPL